MKHQWLIPCVMLGLVVPAVLSAAPEEELYGDRIYFLEDDFREGDYRDYFENTFLGEKMFNQEGKKGGCLKVTYGMSRPFHVTPGKKYVLSVEVFNLGMKDPAKYQKEGKKATFPFSFVFFDNAWKNIQKITGKEIAENPEPLPAQWEKKTWTFTAPANSVMFTFSIHSEWKNCFGPYLFSSISFTELKGE